jgi:tetratricopeptide (TPR) repeat protein
MNRVSSLRPLSACFLIFLCCRAGAQSPAPPPPRDPQKLFEAGEAALHAGKLDEAEHAFRQVVAINPGVAGAYANLGVIDMRRKQWPQALAMLHQAEKLAPEMAGIRLNIGLVYYRQKNFRAAIAPFESVVRQTPESHQARYLLGFCYFFNDRWAETVTTLEPLWEQVSAADQLNYLYVLGRAAELSKNTALEEKAYARMAEIGQGAPEFRMIIGKSHLNRGEYDDAVRELEAAAQADPKLPLVHYYLGMAFVRKQDYERARMEFQKDLAQEPDAAFTYEQLGKVESTLQNETEAAKDFGRAVKLDPQLVESRMGLAKIAEQKKEYPVALAQLNEIIRLEKDNASAHYLRGQVLLHMGREKEGREELAVATKMLNEQRAARHKELEGEPVASPELAREPQ